MKKISLSSTALIFMALFTLGCAPKKNDKAEKEMITETNDAGADKAHNSQNALDWAGTYRGMLPCEDCKGIKTELVLQQQGTYILKELRRSTSEEAKTTEGTFSWDNSGSKITLDIQGDTERTKTYKVVENGIIELDLEGEMYKGENADNYRLNKSTGPASLGDGYWKLIKLQGQDIGGIEGGREPYLVFNEEEQRVAGNNSCNQISGEYELQEGNRIRFGKIITTQMACIPNDIEGPFMETLDVADNYTIHGDTLSLNKARMAPLAQFVLDYVK